MSAELQRLMARQLVMRQDAMKAAGQAQQPAMERPRGADALAAMEEAIQPGAIAPGQYATGGMDVDGPLGDVARSFGSGVVRGGSALVDMPGQLMDAGTQGAAELLGADDRTRQMIGHVVNRMPGHSRGAASEFADMALPGARQYEPETNLGRYAQTVGEFTPGGAFARGGMMMNAVIPGIASEAAGQAAEGTGFETAARVIGAVAAPLAIQGLPAGLSRMFRASIERPSVEMLRGAKTAAYRAVDDAKETFDGQSMQNLADRVRAVADDGTYVPGVDREIDAALRIVQNRAGQETSFSQLDRIRQNLWKRYNAAPQQTVLLDVIDEIDNLVVARPDTNALVSAARLANSRFKKAELLDNAFTRAADQTASTGSGGNILNKYRQAVTSIINNPKQSRWFSGDEIGVMRAFVQGSLPENVMRRIGKLAPGGNGLMLALNLGAAAVNPLALGATAVAQGAKTAADGMARRNADALLGMVAGQAPQAARPGANVMAPLVSAIATQQ